MVGKLTERGTQSRAQRSFELVEQRHADEYMLCAMIDDVLAFWFEQPATNADEFLRKIMRWYQGGPALDAQIRERFTPLVERALAGGLDDWASTPRGRLALILLLDQFTRSIYRDDRRSYAGDQMAQALAIEAHDQGMDKELSIEERQFLLMPFMHAENLALQERAVSTMAKIVADANDWQKKVLAMGVEQSLKYRDIVQRFGRFPHRNSILGRANTTEEDAFLVDWEAKMRPKQPV